MHPFLSLHGTDTTDVNGLLDYAVKKTGLGFNFHGVKWIASQNSIQVVYQWEIHSFFDDGGGEEGEKSWSITFLGIEGDHLPEMKSWMITVFTGSG